MREQDVSLVEEATLSSPPPFSSEILEEIDVLCLFGFESEDFLCSLETWLSKEEKYILWFTKKEEHIWAALKEPKCKVLLCHNGQMPIETFESLCYELVFLRFSYHMHPAAEFQKEENRLLAESQAIQSRVHLQASDYRDFGVGVLKNVQKNLIRTPAYTEWKSLKGACKGIPAIVCGAGPSLNEAIPFLKGMQDRALILAGGAALCSLSHQNIPLHIGSSIDPDPSYSRIFEYTGFEVPFFYQDRTSEQILSLVHGPKVQVPTSGGYALEQWLLQELGLEQEVFDGGWTVTTFCTALAGYLGCNPILFVGMDFAYKPTSSIYAKGVREDKEPEGIEVVDPEVGVLCSKRDWIMAARWLEEYASAHADQRFYQVSKEGLSLKGVPRASWEELCERELLKSYSLSGWVHGAIETSAHRKVDSQKCQKLLSQIQKSLRHSKEICDRLLALFEKEYPNDPRGKGEFVVNLYDLYDEVIYQKLLEPLWQIWKFPIERKTSTDYERDLHQLLFFKKIIQSHL